MMTKLYKYQRKGVRQIQRFRGRALLADEMGLGKSFQALAWADKYLKAGPIVIVCPAFVKYVWEHELFKHFGKASTVLEGRRKKRQRLQQYSDYIIINYDILRSWKSQLRNIKPQLVIVDETQFIANRKAKRTTDVRGLAKDVPHVIGISGTPIENRVRDIWPTLNIVMPEQFQSFLPFGIRFCGPVREYGIWKFDGASNIPELNKTLRNNCMIRRRKKDVLRDLPKKTRQVIPVPLQSYNEYNRIKKDFLGYLRGVSLSKLQRAKKAPQLVQLGYLRRCATDGKMESVFRWIDNWMECHDGKLVIFAVHRRVISAIHERYKNESVYVNGQVVGHKRKLAEKAFQNQQGVRLFIGEYKSAGTGITLTAASDVLLVEFPWTPAKLLQAEDRVHRIGQAMHVNIHCIVARNTLEEDMIPLLTEKHTDANATLDGEETPGDFEFDIRRKLIRRINNESKSKKKTTVSKRKGL